MKVLCSGDLHLGRRSSRLPAAVDAGAHSATAAWKALVELAIAERADLVALSGDLVDRANRYFEAFGPLEAGVRRLTAAGIPTLAVAGNHDFDVLPRLAPSLGRGFRLLGAEGKWERVTVPRDGKAALHLVGWSFPAEHVHTSPLPSIPALPDDGIPVLGLLHGDLEQAVSRYVPLSTGELRGTRVSCWLLGHLHAPRLHEAPGAAPLLYPGSPQALHPNETGAHGAWLLDLQPGRTPSARLVPLSTVRYDEVVVDVSAVADPDELDRRVAEGIRAHLHAVVEPGCGPLRHVSCRVRVVGQTPLHRLVEPRLRGRLAELEAEHGEVRARVERVRSETRPAADLPALAATADAPGVLARFVIALDGDTLDDGHQRLLAELAARTGDVRRARAYQTLGEPEVPVEALRELARTQALLLLDELLAQKEAA